MTRDVEWYGEVECAVCRMPLSFQLEMTEYRRVGSSITMNVACPCGVETPMVLVRRAARCHECGHELPESK